MAENNTKNAPKKDMLETAMALLRAKENSNREDAVSTMKNETDPEEIMRQVLS